MRRKAQSSREGEKGFSVWLRLTGAQRQQVSDLATVLGITVMELTSRAVENELRAVEKVPSVHAAMEALATARAHIERAQAARKAGA